MTHLDQTLKFLYSQMLKEQEGLPPAKRMGFQAWCKKHGILAPEDWESIRRYEITVSSLDGAARPDEDFDNA